MLTFFVSLGVLFQFGICGNQPSFPLTIDDSVNLFSFSFENVDTNCRRDLYEYFEGIQNGEAWALRMADSMEKLPVGLLLGRVVALGQLDECLSAVHPNFTGKHCTVDLLLKNSKISDEALNSIFEKHRDTNSYLRFSTHLFGYGVCIPSTCNSSDLKAIISTVGLNEIFYSDVREIDCKTKAHEEFRVKDYLVVAFFVSMLLVVLVSTVCDMYYSESKEGQNMIFKCFSLKYNWKILFQISEKPSEMNCISGIRFLSMAWVILGHYFFNELLFGVSFNFVEKLEMKNGVSAVPFTNAFVSVDSFFFLSGLFVCFVFFREISEKGCYDAPVALMRRYIRLTPPFVVAILINFTIFSRVTSDPASNMALERMERSCKTYWWMYFLYVHNFNEEARKCVTPSWYLAADMQMFLISPLILYVLLLLPSFAPTYLGLLIAGASLTSFLVCYKNDLAPNYLMDFLEGSKHLEYFYFYTRLAPWIVGIATGYILCGIKAKKITFKPKRVWIVAGWLTSAFLCLASLYGIVAFQPLGSTHSALKKASYRSFHRLGWALGLSWIVLACVEGYGGPVNAFLSLGVFQPLAKLSYCMYLIHTLVQKFRLYQYTSYSTHHDYYSVMYGYLMDLILSIAVSIPMTLMFEMPFIHMAKILFKNVRIFSYPKPNKNEERAGNVEKTKDPEKGGQ